MPCVTLHCMFSTCDDDKDKRVSLMIAPYNNTKQTRTDTGNVG